MGESLPNKENVVPDRTNPQGTTIPSHGRDHEYRDISFRSIVRFGMVLVILTVTTVLLMWGMFEVLDKRSTAADVTPSPFQNRQQRPAGPRLQSNEPKDLATYRAMEDSILHGGPVLLNGSTGAVRIPIESAIEILAQRGLPTRDGAMTIESSDMTSMSGVDTAAGRGAIAAPAGAGAGE